MLKTFRSKVKNFITGPFDSLSILPFSNRNNKIYSKADYLTGYGISLYVNRALNKRAEKVGDIKFQLMKGDKVIENDDILKLLSKPNKLLSGKQFWKLAQKYYDIFGEVYIETDAELQLGGKNKVTQMHLLRSDLCEPKFNEITGELIEIEHRTAKGTRRIAGDQIIYHHNPNPADPRRGESLMQSGMRQVDILAQIDTYQSNILENGGRVEGVFTFKGNNLTRTQLSELKDGFQEEYATASHSGLPLFLSGDAKYDSLGLTPAELSYLETKKTSLSDIVIMTGVPHALLALTSDQTFSNADASINIYLNETIDPLQKALAEKLNEFLVPEDMKLTRVDMTQEDKDEKRKDVETGIKNYFMTPNEARKQYGLDPVENGDDILIPFNISPLGYEAQEEETEPAPSEAKSVKKVHPLKNVDNRRIYHALQLKRLDRRQEKVKSAMKKYFYEQESRLIDGIDNTKSFKTKGILDEAFNTLLEIRLAKETVLPILEQLLQESAEDAKEVAGSHWDFEMSPDVTGWLDKKVGVFAEQITNTTFNKLKKEFAQSLEDGEDRKQLIERIKNTYGDISEKRATTIARTEVHGVTQYGTMQGYKQAGMEIKIYVWAPGVHGGVRDKHKAMDGEERPLNVPFSNGLMFPGDPNGPAEETVNCECFV